MREQLDELREQKEQYEAVGRCSEEDDDSDNGSGSDLH